MALEHAILVSLLERPGSGYELARRFERSIGRFWTATHQQIYRVLKRMEVDGWVVAEEIGQDRRPDKRSFSVADSGRRALVEWLRAPVQPEAVRHELAVKIRGAAFTDEAGRAALISEVERYRADHETLLYTYVNGEKRDFLDRESEDVGQRLQHVVLRGGIAYERMLLDWLDDVLATLRAL
ncbi:PadR family transcriptional regulator [Actinoplanes philippinensis]|uniref:DNA-binding transcriptional regulator, PadR family n=1 Tax=Actinoplanes philippinensis TaxID=35752 RepID=A0A1I2KG09_9ACTN|nr:PadR family transcriptional regulator [Actinoplanes philippinensis]GIE81855.1 PadR family transcriptional regulator [Actinoplanes philippinensis]SFF64051.1 DNA-binding transcriptional regulator, PadR family [Actinoplanes philippinensis]